LFSFVLEKQRDTGTESWYWDAIETRNNREAGRVIMVKKEAAESKTTTCIDLGIISRMSIAKRARTCRIRTKQGFSAMACAQATGRHREKLGLLGSDLRIHTDTVFQRRFTLFINAEPHTLLLYARYQVDIDNMKQ
jgi:hypothetical protein